mgnify:CR=1 FL=1
MGSAPLKTERQPCPQADRYRRAIEDAGQRTPGGCAQDREDKKRNGGSQHQPQVILAEFEARIGNSRGVEFETACKQVERIALLRLRDMLPQ